MALDPVEKDIPQYVRRCWERYQSATEHLRKDSEESLKMWLGGKHQWRQGEIASRIGNNRPYLTINRLKPAVDQVENEARNNPPGPKVRPEGGGADSDGADIQAGLIREYEYRSNAPRAYVTALKYAAAGNIGVFEMATEFCGEKSWEQRIKILEAEDPAMYFHDPDARMACRQDAMWGGKIRVLSRDKLIEEYGDKLKVLNRNLVEQAAGWMQAAMGWNGNQASVNEWTGGYTAKGPFYVCEFYRVKIERTKLTLYSDAISRFDDESVPAGVTPSIEDGKPVMRSEPRHTVKKYVVTALDTLSETTWYGDIVPYFWVMGPEVYIKGKLHRLSLIDGGADSQRGLNYTATSAVEIVNTMTKAPFIGWLGQFDVTNAQGMNPWKASNTQVAAYLELKPEFAVNPTSGEATLLPPPQRNTWEAPIGRLLELATFFIEAIKGTTSVFFDPSIQSVRDAQSGEAIKALQSQTNIGTLNWQSNLQEAVTLSYQQAVKIFREIMDGQRVRTIIKADTQHEIVEINREFPDGIDPKTGKRGKENNITRGTYMVTATAGPKFEDRTDQAVEAMTEVFKIAPGILSAPGVAARFLRMVGEGSPQVEQIADSLMGTTGDMSPEDMRNQLLKLQQSDQAKTTLIQQMHQAMAAKLPELELRKWETMVENLTKIRVAEINASKDRDNAKADLEAEVLQHFTAMAHDTATQAVDHDNAQQAAQLAAQQQPPAAGQGDQPTA